MSLPDVLALDTNCLVYLFQQPRGARGRFVAEQVLRPACRGERRLVLPALVVEELLVQTQDRGQRERGAELTRALEVIPGLTVVPVTTRVATLAARMAALAPTVPGEPGLSLADAVVLATAADAEAVLLTNDRRLAARARQGTVLVLDDLVSAAQVFR